MELLFNQYWSAAELHANFIIILNLVGSMLLGLLIGYERFYQGRAAGMRTYSLVCMASTALTVFCGYYHLWYGGTTSYAIPPDPTRVIQGIVTGIGFLGAGVIMKEGFTISGLSTAASIWMSSAVGVLVGVGFYAAAIALALLSVISMIFVRKLEQSLPQKRILIINLKFKPGFIPVEKTLQESALNRGYRIPSDSISVSLKDKFLEWNCMALALPNKKCHTVSELAHDLVSFDGIIDFTISHARN